MFTAICRVSWISFNAGKIDPSFVITHRLPLDDAADGYKTFHENKGECIKVVLKPHGLAA